MTDLDRPVVITAPGRSGTTLLYEILATHPDLGWVSNWVSRYPRWPPLAALSRLVDTPGGTRWIERRTPRAPRPSEAFGFWTTFVPPYLEMTDDDWARGDDPPVADAALHAVRRRIARVLVWQGRPRFLMKRTGVPLINFFRTVFPSARVLYVERHPVAVVASRIKQRWGGFRNRPQEWDRIPMPEKIEHFANQVATERALLDRYRETSDYLSVRYETLVAHPLDELRRIAEYCALPMGPRFEATVRSWTIRGDANDSWRRTVTEPADQAFLIDRLRPLARRLDYAATP